MGTQLVDQVVEATGLPKDMIKSELDQLMKTAGLDESTITLDDLRLLLANYVQDVLREAKETYSPAAGE